MLAKRFLAVLFILLLVPATAFAQSTYPAPQPPVPPPPPDYPADLFDPLPVPAPAPWEFDGLRIDYQRVDVTIESQIATTHIEQLFVNENDWLLEGTYLFPLPEGAAVSQLTMWVNGRAIDANILEKDEARAIYDEIVRELRDPALLEYVDRHVIQASVFPIPAGEERLIEIEYSYLLEADNGLLHYTFPQATSLYTNVPLQEQSIRVEVRSDEAIRAVYSPTHPVDVFRDGEYRAVAGYEAQQTTADTDFELYYTVSPEEIGLNLLSYREAGQDGFFMLLAAPNVVVDEIVEKDVFLVMDTSGSMEGDKIQQARDAAQYVVDHLNPGDRFNIMAFSTGTRRYAEGLQAQDAPGDAASFINSLEAVGGTNISTALLETAVMVDPTRPTTIIFLTDGLATEGITELDALVTAVGAALPDNARLFAFGVGDDVDPDLLDSLAQNHRGTTTYVRPGEAIDEEVSAFYAKVSTPVLSDITLEINGVQVEQIYPQTLPDLFAGSQLVVVGRYRGGGPVSVRLEGDVNGRGQSFTYTDQQLRESGGDDFIPRLWATRAIGHLLREIRLNGENDELVQSVINLSTRYGIITPYTSYLIEEDDIVEQLGSRDANASDGSFFAIDVEAVTEVTRIVTETEIVEGAAQEVDMAEAEQLMAPETTAGFTTRDTSPPITAVGSKTFVYYDGVWVDTAVASGRTPDQSLTFASDAYFDLLADVPELGEYFALGTAVLVVYDDVVYRVSETGDPAAASVSEVIPAAPDPSEATAAPASNPDPSEATAPGLCGALLAYPILLGFGGVVMLVGKWGRKRD